MISPPSFTPNHKVLAGFSNHQEYHIVLKRLQVIANKDQVQQLGTDVGVFICTLWMRGWLGFTASCHILPRCLHICISTENQKQNKAFFGFQ